MLEAEWDLHRPAVFGTAYRLLGSVTDAEDVVQDVWLRAAQASLEEVRDLRAWLVTVAARRSYDILTSARARRESYVGPWLPEPLLTRPLATGPLAIGSKLIGPDAAEPVLLDDAVTTAMLLVMEELSPPERVAFVLHHTFEIPYDRIAQVLGRSAAATRQLASRAQRKLARSSAAPRASRAEQAAVLKAFRAAYEERDLDRLVSLLAPGVVYTTDGGGEVSAARKQIIGAARVAMVLMRVTARSGPAIAVPAEINGEPGLLLFRGGALCSVDTFEVRDGQITEFRRVMNPRKLSHPGLPRRLPGDGPTPLRLLGES